LQDRGVLSSFEQETNEISWEDVMKLLTLSCILLICSSLASGQQQRTSGPTNSQDMQSLTLTQAANPNIKGSGTANFVPLWISGTSGPHAGKLAKGGSVSGK